MPMPAKIVNHEVMSRKFATIQAEAPLKEAYEAIKKNLEGPPHSPGLVVLDQAGKYAGVLTLDDFMRELARLHRAACDQIGKKEWIAAFFSQCELIGIKKVAEIMSGKRLAVRGGDDFEKSCGLILSKKLSVLAVVDKDAKPVGIITRRKVLEEIAPRLFP
jgi:predicted transcriptional regulator